MDNQQVKYICRSHFVDDAAWNNFLRYKSLQDLKVAAAHNKTSRKQKRLNAFISITKELQEKNETAAANYLRV